jgi:hypothetical protein
MSTGAAAGTGTGGDAGQGTGEQGQPGEGGPDINQLAAALGRQEATQQEMYDFLRQNFQPGEPGTTPEAQPQTPETEPLDLSFLNMDDPSFDPSQMAQQLGQLIESTVEQRVQAGIQSAVQPLQGDVASMRREQEAAALVGEFPELGEAETSQEVLRVAGQLAEASGHPELAGEPWFWRLSYMAGRAADAAQEESGEVPAPAHLESGAGATPAGRGAGMTAEDIVGAKRGASVLPFS